MNANRMLGMVMRMILRKVMRYGMTTGMGGRGARVGSRSGTGPDGNKTARRARRTMWAGRKIGRF